MKEILSIRNLNKTFESGFKLKNINFDIKEGEVVSLIGESGSGKTSISKIIVGLLKAEGQILFKGMDILENPKKINGKTFVTEIYFDKKSKNTFQDKLFKVINSKRNSSE